MEKIHQDWITSLVEHPEYLPHESIKSMSNIARLKEFEYKRPSSAQYFLSTVGKELL